jgi:hypothetical protein
MSTQAVIGIVNSDGSIKTIYLHQDGYPKHAGRLLFETYRNVDKIQQLMELGDLSILGEQIGEKQEFSKPINGMCLAYGRDRDEDNVEAETGHSITDLLSDFRDSGQKFLYLHRDGKWFVAKGKQSPATVLVELTYDIYVGNIPYGNM